MLKNYIAGLMIAGYACGCATIPSMAYRADEQLSQVKNPLQIPSRVTRAVRDATIDGVEKTITDPFGVKGYETPGEVVSTIRENPLLDIGTELAVTTGIGVAIGHNEGAFGYKAFTTGAKRRGAMAGFGIGIISRGLEEAVSE